MVSLTTKFIIFLSLLLLVLAGVGYAMYKDPATASKFIEKTKEMLSKFFPTKPVKVLDDVPVPPVQEPPPELEVIEPSKPVKDAYVSFLLESSDVLQLSPEDELPTTSREEGRVLIREGEDNE